MSNNKAKRLKTRELLDFTSNLSLLLNSGLSVYNSIQMINSFTSGKRLRELTEYLQQGLKKGNSLSSLFEKGNYSLPPLYSGLVNIGDRIGSLSTILPTLKTYLERNKKVRDKFINASIYPLMVLVMLFTGLFFLMLFGIPKIEELFSEIAGNGSQLESFQARITGLKLTGLGLILLILLFAATAVIRRRAERVKSATDKLILRLPFVSDIVKTIDIFNFTFAVETLTKHGIPLSSAVLEAKEVCSNARLKEIFTSVNRDLVSGRGLHKAFSVHKEIPSRMIQWIGIGENTGQTELVFAQLRIYYESEIENLTTRLLGVIEPLLTILVGAIIIYLILNFIVPLFSLFGTIA